MSQNNNNNNNNNTDFVNQVLKKEKSRKAGSVAYDAKEFEVRNNTQWIDSSQVKKCHRCSVLFTLTNRKHHCRNCGNVFCSNCSSSKVVVNGILKRACTDCYTKVMNGFTPELPPNNKPSRASISFVPSTSTATLESKDSISDDTITKPRSNSLTSNNSDTDFTKSTHLKWVEAFLLVRKLDPESSPILDSISPEQFPAQLIKSIVALSIPSLDKLREESLEYNFCFTIPQPSSSSIDQNNSSTLDSSNDSKGFYYCFVSFKQTVNISSTRETFSNSNYRSTSFQQRALVMVSRLPIPNLAYNVLSTIENTLYHVLNPETSTSNRSSVSISGSTNDSRQSLGVSTSSISSSSSSSVSQEITKAFEVSIEQISQNWVPLVLSRGDSEEMNAGGQGLSWYAGLALPFFGDILQFTVSIPRCIGGVTVTHELSSGIHVYPDVDFSSMSLGAAVTFSNGSNIISQFGPYGLIPHLWAIWESIIQGNDVVVVGPTPDAAAQMVIALSSLVLTPVDGYKGCNVKPYITRHSPELATIVSTVKKRKKSLNESNQKTSIKELSEKTAGSFIVGITDPTLLLDLRDFTLLIALSPKRDITENQEFSPEFLRKAEKRSSFSGKMTGANKNLTMEDMEAESLLRFNPKFIAPMRYPTESDFAQDKVYTSSRMSLEEIPIIKEETHEETPYLTSSGSDKPVTTTATIVPQTATVISPSSSSSNTKRESTKRRSESDREKKTPSFLSRSYTTWKNLANRGVYTPGFVVFPSQPVASPLEEGVCKRLKKLSVRDYLILGNRILRDHFDELTAAYFKPMVDEQVHEEEEKELKRKSELKLADSLLSSSNSDESNPQVEQEIEEYEEVKEIIQPKKKLPPALSNLLKTYIHTVETKREFSVNSVTTALVVTILFEFKLVSLFFCLLLVTMQVPDNEIMKSLKLYLPQEKITKKKKVSTQKISTPAASTKTSSSSSSVKSTTIVPKANFSGVWKRGKIVNFEEFAAAQGASYVQRKLASSMTMIHTITMDNELTVIRIQEKGGPITNDALLVIGGDSIEVPVGPKTYLDTATWDSPDVLRVVRLFLPDRDHELIMIRRLENDGKTIRQDQTYHNFGTGVRVDATSYFDYQGPSPNPLPTTVRLKSLEAEIPEDTKSKQQEQEKQQEKQQLQQSNKRDLSGVWIRTRTHNVDSYVGAQGAGFVQRKLAVSVAMTHTITMNPPDLTAFQLQEKGGPLDSDIIYTVDTMPMSTQIMKRNFMDTVTWLPDSNPPTLLVTRIHEDNDFSLIHKRYIEEDDASGEPTLVLVAKHVDHATGTETVGTSWFKYSGPSPNPPPKPSGIPKASISENVKSTPVQPLIKEEIVTTDNSSHSDNKTRTSESSATETTISTPSNENNSTTTPTNLTTTDVITPTIPSQIIDSSSSSITTTTPSTTTITQTESRKLESSGLPKRMLSMTLKVDLSGVWVRVDGMGTNGTSTKTIFSTFGSSQVTHTITMDPPFYSGVRIVESGGPINTDYTFEFGGDYVPTVVNGKKFLERCYWEGEAMVQRRVPETRDYELVMKRYLESPNMGLGGKTSIGKKDFKLRLVTVKTNLKTGDETETIQFFKKTGPTPHVLGNLNSSNKSSIINNSSNSNNSNDDYKNKPMRTVSFGPASTIDENYNEE